MNEILNIERTALGKYVIIKGIVHLYGYKIAGEGPYSGFFEVINQHFYFRDEIKNATFIEHQSELIYESPGKSKILKKD